MPTQRYCMRCAQLAVRTETATEEVWYCPQQHGVVYRAPLETVPETAKALTEPEPEAEEETAPESGEEEEEADKPEPRARAPAARIHTFHKPPPKKHVAPAPKKK